LFSINGFNAKIPIEFGFSKEIILYSLIALKDKMYLSYNDDDKFDPEKCMKEYN